MKTTFYAYCFDAVDVWNGTIDFTGLAHSDADTAEKIHFVMELAVKEIDMFMGWRDGEDCRFGHIIGPGNPHTLLWGARKMENNGSTVMGTQVPLSAPDDVYYHGTFEG